MKKLRWGLILFLYLLSMSSAIAMNTSTPDHLLYLVFDQMRPDYIDRFNLKNFKRLRAMGTNYKEAYVGHLPAVTIVSHLVMSTGLLPKQLPWMDNWMWDAKGLAGKTDEVYYTAKLTQDQMISAMSKLPANTFLAKRFSDKFKKKTIAIGEKDYAVITFGGPYADQIIYLKNSNGVCRPAGVNVPKWISENKRFEINCKDKYGTDNSLYALDGNKYYPGTDTEHLGGDIWVADAAIAAMKNESNWGALFLTFGAIDKFGHMLGETDGPSIHSFETPAHLKDIAQIADQQLGRLLDELATRKLLNSTVIVSTADHGGQTDTVYLGSGGEMHDEPFWINRIKKVANVRMLADDTALRVWLKDPQAENIAQAKLAIQEISNISRIFELVHEASIYKYREIFTNLKARPKTFQKWANLHDEELTRTMASEFGPTLIATLADGTGFGKLGDHGGAQENVQRIPIMVAGPGVSVLNSSQPMRLADIEPLLTKLFKLPLKP